MKKLVRVEVYPNPIGRGYAGDYLVPIYADDSFEEYRGEALYLNDVGTLRGEGMTREVMLAAEALVAAEKLFKPIVMRFFESHGK